MVSRSSRSSLGAEYSGDVCFYLGRELLSNVDHILAALGGQHQLGTLVGEVGYVVTTSNRSGSPRDPSSTSNRTGRPRRLGSESERAKLNVTRAIRTAIRNVAKQAPALGQSSTPA